MDIDGFFKDEDRSLKFSLEKRIIDSTANLGLNVNKSANGIMVNGHLSRVSLNRLQKLVERQKLFCSEGDFNNLEANDLAIIDGYQPCSIPLSEESLDAPGRISNSAILTCSVDRSHPMVRKVTESKPPPGYLGFSTVPNLSSSSFLGRERTDIRSLPSADTGSIHFTPRNQQRRCLEKNPDSSRRMKRVVATLTERSANCSNHGDESLYNPDSWRVGEELIRKHFGPSRQKTSVESKCRTTAPDVLDNGKIGNLATILSSYEVSQYRAQDNLPADASDPKPNKVPRMETEKTDGPPRSSAKKGLYRPNSKSGQATEPSHQEEQTHLCHHPVSRADLQALVRKQRQARRDERRKMEQVERERKERIQRNLAATALAASIAAKNHPHLAKSTHLSAVKKDHSFVKKDDPAKVIRGAAESTVYSVEREQKLDELLRGEDDEPFFSPRLFVRVDGSTTNRSTMESKRISMSDNASPLISTEFGLREDTQFGIVGSKEDALPLSPHESRTHHVVEVVTSPTPSICGYPAKIGSHRGSEHRNASGRSSSKDKGHSRQDLPGLQWLATSGDRQSNIERLHAFTIGQRVKHLLVSDSDEFMEDEQLSTSSVGDHSPRSEDRWMRLEAVGASEPEMSTEEDNRGEVVDDLRTEELEPCDPKEKMESRLCSSKAPIIPLNTIRQSGDSTAFDVRRAIYSDPLRFSAICRLKLSQPTRESELRKVTKATSKHRISTAIHNAQSVAVDSDVPAIDNSHASSSGDMSTSNPSSDSQRTLGAGDVSLNSTVKTLISTEATTQPLSKKSISSSDYKLTSSDRSKSSVDVKGIVTSTPLREQASLPGLNVLHSRAPPRLTAAALSLQLSAEMNHLEALASSMQHVADIESLRQFATAQAESVGLAQLLKGQHATASLGSEQPSAPEFQKATTQARSTAVTPGLFGHEFGHKNGEFQDHFTSTKVSTKDAAVAANFHFERDLVDKEEIRGAAHLPISTPNSNASSSSRSTSSPRTPVRSPKSRASRHSKTSCASSPLPESKADLAKDQSVYKHSAPTVSQSTAQEISSTSDLCTAPSTSSHKTVSSVPVEADSTANDSTTSDHTSIDQDTPMEEKETITEKSCSTVSPASPRVPSTKRDKRSRLQANEAVQNDASRSSARAIGRSFGYCSEARQNSTVGNTQHADKSPPTDARLDTPAMTKLNNGLLERAANLKLRRERAEKLLALSKNLEIEEDEVVRLEMAALNAVQLKRKLIRSEQTPPSFTVGSLSRRSSSRSRNVRNNPELAGTHAFSKSDTARRSTKSLVPVHPASTSCPSDTTIPEASGLSQADAGSEGTVYSSNRPRSRTTHQMGRMASDAYSTDFELHTEFSCGAAADQKSYHSSRGTHNLGSKQSRASTMASRRSYSENGLVETHGRPSDSNSSQILCVSPENKRLAHHDQNRNDAPTLRKQLIEETVSSSSGRGTPPTPRSHPRLPVSESGRRKFLTSTPSAVQSADSMDEDNGHSTDVADDETLSAATSCSKVDYSEMESRIHALHVNLKQQEAILSRINRHHEHVSKDRLARLESTLVQHKKLCTEIIKNIKAELNACESTVRLGSSARDASAPGATLKQRVTEGRSVTNGHEKSSTSADEDSPVNTLVSLAEDLVSATDTEDDLKKLGFDEKSSNRTPSPINRNDDEDLTESEPTLGPTCGLSVHAAASEADSIKSSINVPEPSTLSTAEIQSKKSLRSQTSLETNYSTVFTDTDLDNEMSRKTVALVNGTIAESQRASSMPPIQGTSLVSGQQAPASEPFLLYAATNANTPEPLDSNLVTIREPQHGCLAPLMGWSSKTGSLESVNDSNIPHLTRTRSPPIFPARITRTDQLQRLDVTPPPKPCRPSRITPTQALVNDVTDELLNELVSEAINSALKLDKSKKCASSETTQHNHESEDQCSNDHLRAVRKTSKKADNEEGPVVPALHLSDDADDQKDSADLVESDSSSESRSLIPCLSPSVVFVPEHLRGQIPSMAARVDPLIRQAVEYLWEALHNASGGIREWALQQAISAPPQCFSPDMLDEADLDPELHKTPDLRFVSRSLLFDLVSECVTKIYAGEDEEIRNSQKRRPHITSTQFRLWEGPTRPSTFDRLLKLVQTRVQEVLNSRSNVFHPDDKPSAARSLPVGGVGTFTNNSRFSRLAQWTLSKKPYLDRLLELEMRADEGSWLSYVPEERRLKSSLADQLWKESLDEALEAVLRRSQYSMHKKSSSILGFAVAT
ncbi:unnamed protein product [Calicophoron daubneyi]|uniref:Uncharacterized protein n=1 Tax=Calicophoron daubneyi TaxID=300641 RepID=A0AAV2T9U0_CALDB